MFACTQCFWLHWDLSTFVGCSVSSLALSCRPLHLGFRVTSLLEKDGSRSQEFLLAGLVGRCWDHLYCFLGQEHKSRILKSFISDFWMRKAHTKYGIPTSWKLFPCFDDWKTKFRGRSCFTFNSFVLNSRTTAYESGACCDHCWL